eukprot:3239338-Pleurochrysis_carterae.AAC.1
MDEADYRSCTREAENITAKLEYLFGGQCWPSALSSHLGGRSAATRSRSHPRYRPPRSLPNTAQLPPISDDENGGQIGRLQPRGRASERTPDEKACGGILFENVSTVAEDYSQLLFTLTNTRKLGSWAESTKVAVPSLLNEERRLQCDDAELAVLPSGDDNFVRKFYRFVLPQWEGGE